MWYPLFFAAGFAAAVMLFVEFGKGSDDSDDDSGFA